MLVGNDYCTSLPTISVEFNLCSLLRLTQYGLSISNLLIFITNWFYLIIYLIKKLIHLYTPVYSGHTPVWPEWQNPIHYRNVSCIPLSLSELRSACRLVIRANTTDKSKSSKKVEQFEVCIRYHLQSRRRGHNYSNWTKPVIKRTSARR